MMRTELRGLYAIADRSTLDGRDLVAAAGEAMAGGAALVQYRDKIGTPAQRMETAQRLVALGQARGVPVIINDDVELALRCGAAGVHVGADDDAPERARERLGPDAIIGVSCYDRLERALAVAHCGVDYVAFGRMYPSTTKPGGPRPALDILTHARAATGLGICAIGGITVDRAPELITAGADLLAVIGDLFTADDIQARANAYLRAFADARGRPE